MKTYENNPVVKHSIAFALMIIKYCAELDEHKKYIISKQLLRCGTAIGANVMEAQSAESKADFIHKLKIADKEAIETKYWLYLCKHSDGYPNNENLSNKLSEISRLLNSIVSSAKGK